MRARPFFILAGSDALFLGIKLLIIRLGNEDVGKKRPLTGITARGFRGYQRYNDWQAEYPRGNIQSNHEARYSVPPKRISTEWNKTGSPEV
jgi:hypothetical protein